jgi:hypothetical protein
MNVIFFLGLKQSLSSGGYCAYLNQPNIYLPQQIMFDLGKKARHYGMHRTCKIVFQAMHQREIGHTKGVF